MNKVKLIISNRQFLHQLLLDSKEQYKIGSNPHDDLYFKDAGDFEFELAFDAEKAKWILIQGTEEVILEVNQPQKIKVGEEELSYNLIEARLPVAYQLAIEKNWHIGSDQDAVVQLPKAFSDKISLTKTAEGWELQPLGCALFVNYRFTAEKVLLKAGDVLYLAGSFVTIFQDELHVEGDGALEVHLPKLATSSYGFYDEYPDYHRSPRIIYRDPEEKVSIGTPDSEPTKPNEQLLKLIVPPLMMLGATIAMSFLMPRGPYVLITAGTTIVTTIFSISSYIKSRKQYKIDSAERVHIYNQYLVTKSEELYRLNQEQRVGKLYHYPDILTLTQQVAQYKHRIYEKTPLHFDFLTYRLGLGRVPSSSDISYKGSDGQKKLNDLEQEGRNLWTESRHVEGVPVTTELTLGPIGYIGPRPLVLEQLQLLVNQLAFFHSYHDLQFITIFPEDELEQWNWLRWLPHATLQDMNVRGFVYHQRSRDQVLNSLTQILKNRQNAKSEGGRDADSTIFTPHYVVLITDVKLILDHTIMEFFNEDPTELGCSIIFVQDVMSSLSENVKTVIDIRDRNTGVMVLENGDLKNTSFALDHFPVDFDKERLPRTLAPLNHLQNLKNSIPESVTFLEMYEVERFEELNVQDRWAAHSPHKSLAVPLGLRGKEDVVMLNLHEKAHGPHGLVAGTTGSGKSEIVQSYILSLAVNFHPYDVAFLLIDYKGGGMANLFRNLPHLLGSITNLDGAQSMRALISINAELKRRQRLFSENNVNHINQYQKLYKDGDVSDPMPHLFLISDEFAELKAEQPEFMSELVSTARIGRSLGIHLILATQKPSGVVNDQIWSNSKFKLALKVADRADSMEMLKTPDAAEITQAGRAYLQVGNNEIYELFQSAWSGADYQPDKDESTAEDLTVYGINDLGQYDILSEDLSGLENADEVKTVPTELDAIIDGIQAITEKAGIEALPRPWLPPLAARNYLPLLDPVSYQEAWATENKGELVPVIGIADIPTMQAQETLSLNLSKEGHMAVYSSPAFGKSTFLQTIMMGLARKHNPERLHSYLLDFGTNGLLPLRILPHIADTMNSDEDEKIGKFIRRMATEIKRRKKMLSQYAVANLAMYEKASGNEEPSILILVDGYEGFKGMKYEDPLEKILTQISREGAGIGLHLIISAGRTASMRANLQSNIKLQLALKMIDDAEPRNIVGRTSLAIDDLPGRGLIKLEDPALFQAALPTEGEETLDIIDAIQAEAKEMDEHWTGERPEEIPVMPDVIDFEEFVQRKAVANSLDSRTEIPIGLEFEALKPFVLEKGQEANKIVLASTIKEQTDLLNIFIKIAGKKQSTNAIHLFDSEQGALSEYENQEFLGSYLQDKENIAGFFAGIKNEIEVRQQEYKRIATENGQQEAKAYIQSLSYHLLMIVNIGEFGGKLMAETADQVLFAFEKGNEVGISFIISGVPANYNQNYDSFSKAVKAHNNGYLMMKYGDQTLLKATNLGYNTPKPGENEVFAINNDLGEHFKIPKN